mmetsp:Transcript_4090/g.8530  ORF Transcript_4090/g.8530 Transcript_4090/m.8530 type:complete len:163 (+) Transcript_4090:118-606(+)
MEIADCKTSILVLISLWVLDLGHFCYDQYGKINAFSDEFEKDFNGENFCRNIITVIAHEIFCAIALSLKILSILFFVVVFNNIDDAEFLLLLKEYSSSLSIASECFAVVTVLSLACLLAITSYVYCCARKPTEEAVGDESNSETTSATRKEAPYAAIAVACV